MEPEWASRGPERVDWRFERVDLVHERADLRHRVDLGFERADLRANSLILGLTQVVDDLCIHIYGEFSASLPPSPSVHPPPFPLTQILVLRPKSQFQGPNPGRYNFKPERADLKPKRADLGP